MSVKKRIKIFIESQKMSISEFEKSISVGNGYINNISKSIGIDKLNLILEKYSNLNVEWLITGKGEMLRDNTLENLNLDPRQSVTYKELYEKSKTEIYQLHEQIGYLKAESEKDK
jgi:transcriptional regulator with XRE-family HTH domain